MTAPRKTLRLLAIAVLAATTTLAHASDRRHDRGHSGWSRQASHHSWQADGRSGHAGRHGERHANGDSRHRHHHPNRHGGAYVGGDGLPSIVPGVGTFAGGISAVRVRGNGIYFAGESGLGNSASYRTPGPKIISIDEDVASGDFLASDACQWEAGVCVIRGTN